jgi:3-oxoacyl-[acyl-carrier protein] reductase
VTGTAPDLGGKVAVVTGVGGAHGIGFAVARALGARGAALVVSAASGRVRERAAELPAGTVAVVGDLTRPGTAEQLVATAASGFGRVDIAVNCAGLTSLADPETAAGRIEDVSFETWRSGVARNLDSAFLFAKAALPALAATGAGRLVMVASLTGPVMAMRGEIAYGAAKAGLVGLVRGLALDAAESGVTVNAVAPGWIHTDSQTAHEHLQGLRTPMRRSGTADEVAGPIGYLCTPSASYITGQCLVVDGGNSIAEERA